jgi:hypothetical protein
MPQIASDFKATFGSCFADCDIGRAWQLMLKINFLWRSLGYSNASAAVSEILKVRSLICEVSDSERLHRTLVRSNADDPTCKLVAFFWRHSLLVLALCSRRTVCCGCGLYGRHNQGREVKLSRIPFSGSKL